MKSMTGYGTAKLKSLNAEISVSVKAVNGRFLETRFHAPKEYVLYESALKKILSKNFRRGTVDIYIVRQASSDIDIKVNFKVAKKWILAHRKLAHDLGIPVDSQALLDKVSSFPQIFDYKEIGQVRGREKSDLIEVFSRAVNLCDIEKKREGQILAKHLQTILVSLEKIINEIVLVREKAKEDLQKRFADKIKTLQKEVAIDPARVVQEMVIALDKSDITEELERLKEHVSMCKKSLNVPTAVGKKLDFYSQELLREINTIGAKANYAILTEKVVHAKSLVEAFKEQVQNVE